MGTSKSKSTLARNFFPSIKLGRYKQSAKRPRVEKAHNSLGYQTLESRQLLAAVAASYSADFPDHTGQLTPGWQYQWNAPINGNLATGSIDVPTTSFEPLKFTESFTSWTPDGDRDPQTNPSAGFTRLSREGGHPGSPGGAELVPRYAIASYTVPESGFYEIEESFIGLKPIAGFANTDGVEYRVFVNRNEPVVEGTVEQGERNYFDEQLGYLHKGDTIHVAFGSGGTQSYDYFTTDFTIVRDLDHQQTVGQFQTDFSGENWQYYWNAPTGWTADSLAPTNHRDGGIYELDSYLPLLPAGNGFLSADGDLSGLNSSPDHFLRLNNQGGQVGAGFVTPVFQDRFAIAAFTIPHSGNYAITESFLSVVDRSNDGVELVVHVDGQSSVQNRMIVAGGTNKSFDLGLGYLSKGQTVYFAFGANGNHVHDTFETDFKVVRHVPRAAPDLSLLETERAVISANATRFGSPGAVADDNQDDWRAIKSTLEYASANDINEVTFENGIYNLSSSQFSARTGPFFTMSRFENLVINGNGATWIVDDHTRALFNLHGASNIIFKDLTIDYAERVPAQGIETNDLYKPLTFTQGIISNVNRETNTFMLTVNTDAFIDPDNSFVVGNSQGWGYVLDANVDGRLKIGSDWHYPTKAIARGNSPSQFFIRVAHTEGLSNGDRYILQRRHNVPIFGVYNNSDNVSFINVTAYSAPSVFVSSLQSEFVNVIDSQVSIRPDAWTSTANTQRWKSINGDGVHVQSNRTGVWVEGSSFEGLGDDVMNFYTFPMTVHAKLSDTQFTVGLIVTDSMRGVAPESLRVGDHLTFFDPLAGQVMKEVQVIAVDETTVPNPTSPGNNLRLQTITIDQPVRGVIVGDNSDFSGLRNETTIFNRSTSRSAVVQDTYFGNSRRYGNFLMADNVQLIDNVYEGLSDEAIAAHNEPGWPLGLFASDVLIQGNEFINNGFSLRYLFDEFHSGSVAFKSAKYVDPRAPGNSGFREDHLVDDNSLAYRNIQIRDNVFYHWRKSAISIRNAEHVVIHGNTISDGIPRNLVELPAAPIQIEFAERVEVISNTANGNTEIVDSESASELSTTNTQYVFNAGLEAWLKFDAGNALTDSSGNQVNPKFNFAGIGEGKFDAAVLLNGSNSVTLDGVDQSSRNERTVSLWFNANRVDGPPKQVLYEEGDTSNGFNIYIENGILFVGAWANGTFSTFLQTEVNSDRWNHVAFVLDGNRNKLRGYLNGEKFAVGNAFALPAREGDVTLGAAGLEGTRFSGAASVSSGFGFAGRIDEVKIFNRVLGDGEIEGLAGRTL